MNNHKRALNDAYLKRTYNLINFKFLNKKDRIPHTIWNTEQIVAIINKSLYQNHKKKSYVNVIKTQKANQNTTIK